MEHYDVKDLTLRAVPRAADEPEFADLDAGIVIQAYLKDSRDDLADLIAWSARRAVPVTVRLVKGAYWDTETVAGPGRGLARARVRAQGGDRRQLRALHPPPARPPRRGAGRLRHPQPAVARLRRRLRPRPRASPTAATRSRCSTAWPSPSTPPSGASGCACGCTRRWASWCPGMAYLVRRLLENTSNESFVRHRFAEGRDLDELLAPPAGRPPARARAAGPPGRRPTPTAPAPTSPSRWPSGGGRRRAPPSPRRSATSAGGLRLEVPGGDRRRRGAHRRDHRVGRPGPPRRRRGHARPRAARPRPTPLSTAAQRGVAGVAAHARAPSGPACCSGPPSGCAPAASDLAALEVFEAGKPWKEADADVCEAIDFCEYYGREMLRLDAGRRGAVAAGRAQHAALPGQGHRRRHRARGTSRSPSPPAWSPPPWSPATPCCSSRPSRRRPSPPSWSRRCEAGGLPDGVLAFLPGVGEEVGAYLVEHPDVAFVTFTGSKAVGPGASTRRRPCTGPGSATSSGWWPRWAARTRSSSTPTPTSTRPCPIVVYSAFGYSGQKCSAASRLVVRRRRLRRSSSSGWSGAAAELRIGHPATWARRWGR